MNRYYIMLIAAVAAIVLGATQLAASAARPIVVRPSASVQQATSPKGSCAEFVVARIMPITGHEADSPVWVCGTPARGEWFCKVTSGEWPMPGVKLACTRVRVKP